MVKENKNKESNIGKWLRQLFGFMFLDPNEVELCFENDFKNDKPKDTSIQKVPNGGVHLVQYSYLKKNGSIPTIRVSGRRPEGTV